MKTWFVTTVKPNDNGSYDQGLAAKLQYLEGLNHVIFTVVTVSGGVQIISYTE